jgi:hypothetical protein
MFCPALARARHLSFVGAGILGFFLSDRPALGSDFVTVRAWADPDYVAKRAARTGSKDETYVVAKGEYFDGACRDGSISAACFPEILHFLAPTLVKQRYFPAKDPKTADQLLVVHWGTTIAYMNDYVQTGATTPAPSGMFHDSNMGPMATAGLAADLQMQKEQFSIDQQSEQAQTAQIVDQTSQAMTTATVAGLLGYTRQLAHERQKLEVTEVERTLTSNLAEDRYFVILQAYDFPKLIKKHERKLLWTAHMSMRSAGMNFTLALPRMGNVASDLYGQNIDDVVTTKFLADRYGSVEIGPITILGDSGSRK